MTTTSEHFAIAHELKKRIRIEVPAIRKNREKAFIFEILLRKRGGIKSVRTVPDTGAVIIYFNPDEIPRKGLIGFLDAVIAAFPKTSSKSKKKKPLSADKSGSPQEITVAIEGMTCASCALLIELVLTRREDVEKASVNFASETATVCGVMSKDEIFRILKRLGYRAHPMNTLSQRKLIIEKEKERLKKSKREALIAAILSAPVVLLGMAVHHPTHRSYWIKYIELLFATPVVLFSGRRFFTRAFSLAKLGTTNMDTLIAIGSGSAYIYSVAALVKRKRELYFEAAAGIITLILFGKYLEEKARFRAGDAIRSLIELQPLTASVIRNGKETKVDIDDVKVGEEVVVRPGERIPVDGQVVFGSSTVDESLITGESMPVIKTSGAKVTGGTMNGAGTIRFTTTAVGGDTVLSGIISMVEHAQASKVPVQRLADKVSSVFVPAVIGIAGLTLTGWLLAGYRLTTALMNSVSVLLIACPCSLGLATPTAIITGTGRAAKEGVYIGDVASLEIAGKLTALVFDKTGTITEGKPMVADFVNVSRIRDENLIKLAASAEHYSEHHLGNAILAFARSKGVELFEAAEFKSHTGKGVKAVVNDRAVVVGNESLLKSQKITVTEVSETAERFMREGKTPVYIGVDGKLAGVMAISDRPKKSSRATIEKLKAMGIEIYMVTGDNLLTAQTIAKEVGIHNIVAKASPSQKVKIINSLKESGKIVGMVGDGINDAPALAVADVGFAIGTGTDVANETAQMSLVNGDLEKALIAISLSKRTMRTIKQNLFWAFIYNTVGIPMAAFGKLSPTIASGAMALSSVSVVANSLRLQKNDTDI